jgi:hypothetical protein
MVSLTSAVMSDGWECHNILGSHGGKYDDESLLGYSTM